MERDILTTILFIITVVIALLARRRFKQTGGGLEKAVWLYWSLLAVRYVFDILQMRWQI